MIPFASLPINDADWVETRGRGSSFHIIPILTHLVYMQNVSLLFAYTTVSLLHPFSRWLLIKAGSFKRDKLMILVKLEFPSLMWNKELCSCPFNGQIPALPSDSEARVPLAYILLLITLHNLFQCSESCLHLWQLDWNIFWAEHFKVHMQECPGIGVFFFFFPQLVLRNLCQCTRYTDQNRSE